MQQDSSQAKTERQEAERLKKEAETNFQSKQQNY